MTPVSSLLYIAVQSLCSVNGDLDSIAKLAEAKPYRTLPTDSGLKLVFEKQFFLMFRWELEEYPWEGWGVRKD
jgi:hypothetical protein